MRLILGYVILFFLLTKVCEPRNRVSLLKIVFLNTF